MPSDDDRLCLSGCSPTGLCTHLPPNPSATAPGSEGDVHLVWTSRPLPTSPCTHQGLSTPGNRTIQQTNYLPLRPRQGISDPGVGRCVKGIQEGIGDPGVGRCVKGIREGIGDLRSDRVENPQRKKARAHRQRRRDSGRRRVAAVSQQQARKSARKTPNAKKPAPTARGGRDAGRRVVSAR